MVFSSKAAGGLKLVPVTSSPSTTSLPPVVVPIYTRYPEAPGTAFQVILAHNHTSSAPSPGVVLTSHSGSARSAWVMQLISVHPVARPAALTGISRRHHVEEKATSMA